MKKTKLDQSAAIIPLLLCLVMTLFGCGQDKAMRAGKTEGYILAKRFLETYYDSIYANPTALRVRLSDLQQQMPDSDGWYMMQLYKCFAVFAETGDEDAFLAASDTVMDYCRRVPEAVHLKASCLNLRSVVFQAQNTDSAINCLKEAYDCLNETEDKTDQVLFLINMADVYRMTNRQPEASQCFHLALAKSDSLKYDKMLVGIHLGLGQLYSNMNRFDVAEYFFNIADSLQTVKEAAIGRDTLPYAKDRFLLESTKGNMMYAKKDYEQALVCFLKAKEAAEVMRNQFFSFSLYVNLSELFALTDRLDSAKYYMDKANEIEARGLNIDADFYCNTVAADIALRENDLAKAQRILSIPYDKQCVNKQYLQIRQRKLSDFYVRKGDYRQAYLYEKEAASYDDSIRSLLAQVNIAEMSLRYKRDTTLLNSSLVIAQHETRNARMNFFVALVAILLVLVAGEGAFRHKKLKREHERLRSEAQNKMLQLRMNAMYNRASPHLIFNAVNNAKGQYPEPVFDKLTDVLRDTLLLNDRIAMPLCEEIRMVRDYVELYKLTHPAMAEVVFDIADDINSEQLVPAMCIQIPVENALKHAFVEIKGGENITVKVWQDGKMRITITDNGVGFQPETRPTSANSTGNGLKLLFEEYQILNQLNGENITFNISDNEGKGTKTEITIPNDYEYIHNDNY